MGLGLQFLIALSIFTLALSKPYILSPDAVKELEQELEDEGGAVEAKELLGLIKDQIPDELESDPEVVAEDIPMASEEDFSPYVGQIPGLTKDGYFNGEKVKSIKAMDSVDEVVGEPEPVAEITPVKSIETVESITPIKSITPVKSVQEVISQTPI